MAVQWPADGEGYAFLEGNRSMACLLVHGFTGSPNDMRPVASGLMDAGFAVRAVRLPGHCQRPEDLNASTCEEWSDAVAEATTQMRAHFDRVLVCGLSMGGLLTLRLAIDHPDLVAGLVTLAAPTRFPPLFHVGLGLYKALGRPGFMALMTKPPRKEGQEERYLEFDSSGGVYPMNASLELEVLRNAVIEKLDTITQPILVLHGKRDPTTQWQSALDIISGVNSEANRLVLLQHSLHVLPMDIERERVVREVVQWAVAGDERHWGTPRTP